MDIENIIERWNKAIEERKKIIAAIMSILGHDGLSPREIEYRAYDEKTDMWIDDDDIFHFEVEGTGAYWSTTRATMPRELVDDYLSGKITIEEAKNQYEEYKQGPATEGEESDEDSVNESIRVKAASLL